MAYRLDSYLKDFSRNIIDFGVSPVYAELVTIFINDFIFILVLTLVDKILKRFIIEVFKIFNPEANGPFSGKAIFLTAGSHGNEVSGHLKYFLANILIISFKSS